MQYDTKDLARGQYQPIATDSRFFDEFDPQYLTKASRGSVDRLNAFYKDMQNRGGKTVLDVGCNIGFFCHALQAKGLECTGIDSDEHSRAWEMPSVIGTAKKLSKIYGVDPEFIKASYLDIESTRKFDFVLYLSIFHHLFRYADRNGIENIEGYCINELKRMIDRTNDTLYLEMSFVFPEVAVLGWTLESVKKLILDITGNECEVIHTSPDAHLEPRVILAIRK